MWKGGDEKGGYEVTVDLGKPRIHLRAWGIWSSPLAEQYLSDMRDEIFPRMMGRQWTILTDGSEFAPQREEVQRAIGELMGRAPKLGMTKAANVIGGVLDRMQLDRIAREAGMPGLKFFTDLDEAAGWLDE